MEASKEQIQYIDNRPYKKGIKYWDLRIEMIDHIVSDLEKNLETNDFKKDLQTSLKRIGWSGNLSHINKAGWKNVNRKYRKIYFKGFVYFFKKPLNTVLFLIFFSCFFLLSRYLEHTVFLKVSYILFTIPILGCFYLFFKSWREKLGKSVHKEYGISYLCFSFVMLNAVLNFVRMEGGFPIEYHNFILLILIPAHFVFTFSGYQVYKMAMYRVKEMRKELLS
jgi:hypothetical protein